MASGWQQFKGGLSGTYRRFRVFLMALSLLLVAGLSWLNALRKWFSYPPPSWDPLLQAALVTAGVAAVSIIFELTASLADRAPRPPTLFRQLVDALPAMRDAVARGGNRPSIKILAGTGGTTVTTVLPALEQEGAGAREVVIGVLDFDSPYGAWVPRYWRGEILENVKRLQERLRSGSMTGSVLLWKILPPVHGVLINDADLFIGFYDWTKEKPPVLSGAQEPHLYFRRGEPGSKLYFELFNSWLEHCPNRKPPEVIEAATSTDGAGGGEGPATAATARLPGSEQTS